jgi:hypothetical protein
VVHNTSRANGLAGDEAGQLQSDPLRKKGFWIFDLTVFQYTWKELNQENQSVWFAKPECLILEFEFLSKFFVNLFLEVLQVMVIA